jgi:hypothetical protein
MSKLIVVLLITSQVVFVWHRIDSRPGAHRCMFYFARDIHAEIVVPKSRAGEHVEEREMLMRQIGASAERILPLIPLSTDTIKASDALQMHTVGMQRLEHTPYRVTLPSMCCTILYCIELYCIQAPLQHSMHCTCTTYRCGCLHTCQGR